MRTEVSLADIAILEVAMRNALTRQLEQLTGGADWYTSDLGLDNRSTAAITRAWKDLPAAQRSPGRVVAKLMFAFWRNLLEAGGDIGDGPRRVRADYEKLWRTQLKNAFPGGRLEAATHGAQFTRSWTLGVVKNVHALRTVPPTTSPWSTGSRYQESSGVSVPPRATTRAFNWLDCWTVTSRPG